VHQSAPVNLPRTAGVVVIRHLLQMPRSDVELFGVSRDMIRLLLRNLKAAGRVEYLGRGPGSKW